METFVLTVHIVVSIVLVGVILLQSGKEGMGVVFGGGSGSVFGSSGAGGLLVKITTVAAIIFLVTSLSYTYMTGHKGKGGSSVMDKALDVPAPKKPGGFIEENSETKSESGAKSESVPTFKPDASPAPTEKSATPEASK